MKIGRNELCPCGSGLKYKRCCLDRKDTMSRSSLANITTEIDEIMKQRVIKQCVHPRKEECSERIVRAHSIQNNRILTKLAVQGEVIALREDSLFFRSGQAVGRKIATTFSGFCKYHDMVTFRDIENREFEGDLKQLFLFAYRAFALEYHRKMEQLKVSQIQFAQMPSIAHHEEQLRYYRALQMGISDNSQTKELLDQGLLTEDYNLLNHCVWEIPYEIEFATSTAFGLYYDINGQEINDYSSDERIRSLFVSVFPAEQKSFCLFSWLGIDDAYYRAFGEQFSNLDDNDKKKYINNLLPVMTENIVISPRLWKAWGKSKQRDFETLFHLSVLFERDSYRDLIQDTLFDLFER